jgi:hypothetical protein
LGFSPLVDEKDAWSMGVISAPLLR